MLRFCAAAKIAGTPKQYHQLTQAHGNIQKEMRRDIRAPTPYTTREQFIADMTAQKPTWIDLYINNSSFKEGKDNTQQNDQRSGGGNRGQRNGANRDYASSNGPSRNNRYYNNTNDNQHDRNRNDYDKPTTQVTVTNEYDSRKKPDREREDKSKKDWDGKQDGGRKDWKNNRTPRASFQTGANVVDYDEHEAESENDSDLDSYGDEDELHPPEQVEVGFVDIMAKPVNIRSNAVNFYVPLPSNVQPVTLPSPSRKNEILPTDPSSRAHARHARLSSHPGTSCSRITTHAPHSLASPRNKTARTATRRLENTHRQTQPLRSKPYRHRFHQKRVTSQRVPRS